MNADTIAVVLVFIVVAGIICYATIWHAKQAERMRPLEMEHELELRKVELATQQAKQATNEAWERGLRAQKEQAK